MDRGDGGKSLEQLVVADGTSDAEVVGGGASIEAEKSGDEVGEPGSLVAVGLGVVSVTVVGDSGVVVYGDVRVGLEHRAALARGIEPHEFVSVVRNPTHP